MLSLSLKKVCACGMRCTRSPGPRWTGGFVPTGKMEVKRALIRLQLLSQALGNLGWWCGPVMGGKPVGKMALSGTMEERKDACWKPESENCIITVLLIAERWMERQGMVRACVSICIWGLLCNCVHSVCNDLKSNERQQLGAVYTMGTCHKGLLGNLGAKDGAFGRLAWSDGHCPGIWSSKRHYQRTNKVVIRSRKSFDLSWQTGIVTFNMTFVKVWLLYDFLYDFVCFGFRCKVFKTLAALWQHQAVGWVQTLPPGWCLAERRRSTHVALRAATSLRHWPCDPSRVGTHPLCRAVCLGAWKLVSK